MSHTRAFAIGASVNLAFVVAEIAAGFMSGSMALVADAVHNFADVVGLLLAWIAAVLARRPPNAMLTYGWGRGSILAALANASILLIGVGAIGVEAVQRLIDPHPIDTGIVMAVAAAGIVVNGGSALLFLRDRHSDLNIRAQFAHLAGDAAIAAGVVIAALAIRLTGWQWLDPLTGLAVSALIVVGTWGLMREAFGLAIDAVPSRVKHADVLAWLGALPGVAEVHDLHIWALSTTETALTVHLVREPGAPELVPHELSTALQAKFGIGHTTMQIEADGDAVYCRLRPDEVI